MDPEGPAHGALEVEDVIVAMDGDVRGCDAFFLFILHFLHGMHPLLISGVYPCHVCKMWLCILPLSSLLGRG